MKIEFLRILIRLELDPVRTEMLTAFFETYLNLNTDEEQHLEKELQVLNSEEVRVLELISSYRRKGRDQGRIEEGKMLFCKFLDVQFGKASTSLQEKVKQTDDLSRLNSLTDRIFAVKSLEEAREVIDHTFI
ncbi:hypothetical protein EV207_16515 [Scopulibacillus darangshiensis]|uniref:Uncharacterized protein n=1 Tax=Scopulibacillus darangshiensis TaxID=442528 RepID=A0A4R2NDX2_9BACL|nr:hypothetical protein [Scopulibacillus darangshiensis]TCP19298.1 hypothetical protein EV207_16515 [Scopulibacillus darangshiensis]